MKQEMKTSHLSIIIRMEDFEQAFSQIQCRLIRSFSNNECRPTARRLMRRIVDIVKNHGTKPANNQFETDGKKTPPLNCDVIRRVGLCLEE